MTIHTVSIQIAKKQKIRSDWILGVLHVKPLGVHSLKQLG